MVDALNSDDDDWLFLCDSIALENGKEAVLFDVVYDGQTCRAFAVRYQNQVHAYLNRCRHVSIELDWVPGQFFDSSGQWIVCSTHGAIYQPASGGCAGGPCRDGLLRIDLMEADGRIYWHADQKVSKALPHHISTNSPDDLT